MDSFQEQVFVVCVLTLFPEKTCNTYFNVQSFCLMNFTYLYTITKEELTQLKV